MTNIAVCYVSGRVIPDIYIGTPTFLGLPKFHNQDDLKNHDIVFACRCGNEKERVVKKMKRIALIIPHTDTTLETNLKRFLPDEYVIHTQRIWLDEVGEVAEKKMVDVDLPIGLSYLKGITEFDGVVFGCTSASAVYGKEGLKRLENYLSEEMKCPSISAFGAVLSHLEIGLKVGLITPYTKDVNEFMVKSMWEFGVNVTFNSGLGLKDDREISKVEPKAILDFVITCKENLEKYCDVIFISCTNFQSMEVRSEIENRLNMKTITSNFCICNCIKQDSNQLQGGQINGTDSKNRENLYFKK